MTDHQDHDWPRLLGEITIPEMAEELSRRCQAFVLVYELSVTDPACGDYDHYCSFGKLEKRKSLLSRMAARVAAERRA